MKTPDSADCASSVALGSVTAACARSLDREARAGRRVLLRPYRHPVAVLHLLDAHEVVAVVARAVEVQPAGDGVHLVLLEPRPDRLVVEAACAADPGFEDLPRCVRRRGLHLDARVRDAGFRRPLVIEL